MKEKVIYMRVRPMTCPHCELDITQEDLFWAQIDRSGNDCWVWKGRCRDRGYGLNNVKIGTTRAAHRIAWEYTRGPIPEGLFVCHKCDNPPCCNPDHLFLGTASENAHDRDRKGRSRGPKGEKSSGAKLTEIIVSEIRARYASGEMGPRALSRNYDVSISTIHSIVRGKSWTDIPGYDFPIIPKVKTRAKPITRKKMDEATILEIDKLRLTGLSYEKIAKKLEIGVQAVGRVVNRKT